MQFPDIYIALLLWLVVGYLLWDGQLCSEAVSCSLSKQGQYFMVILSLSFFSSLFVVCE